MKGKFPVVKLIGIIVCVIGIALTVLGAIFGNQKYRVTPADARNSVVWVQAAVSVPNQLATYLKQKKGIT